MVVVYLKKWRYVATPIYMQNRCYSGRQTTLPLLEKMGISHFTLNSPSWLHMCTALLVPHWGLWESPCMFVWDGSTLQLQFTRLHLVTAVREATLSTSLWRNQPSVLALPFPPLIVELHKAQDFSPSQQPGRYRLINRMAAGGCTGQDSARQTKVIQ